MERADGRTLRYELTDSRIAAALLAVNGYFLFMEIVPIETVFPRGGPNLRAVNPARVKSLAESIAEIGLQNPISVLLVKVRQGTAYSHDGKKYQLVAGEHRWKACLSLGLKEIPVNVLSLNDLQCELWQVDENLMRSELTELERAEHLRHRKEIYLVLHPETKRGANREEPSGQFGHTDSAESFVEDAASKLDSSERDIRRAVHRAEHIAPEVKDAIRDTPIADTGVELDALAKMPEAEQAKAVEMVKSGEVKTVREAAAVLDTVARSHMADPKLREQIEEDTSLTPDEARCVCEEVFNAVTLFARHFSCAGCGDLITTSDLVRYILASDPEILIRKQRADDDQGMILGELKAAYDLLGPVVKALLKSEPDVEACRARLAERLKKRKAQERREARITQHASTDK